MAFHEGYRSGDLVFPNNGIATDNGPFLHRSAGHHRTVTDTGLAADFSFIGNEGRTAYPGLSGQEGTGRHDGAFAADGISVDPGTIVFLRQIFLALDIAAQGTGANGFAYPLQGPDAVQAGIFGMFDVSDLILLRRGDLLHREVEVVVLPEMLSASSYPLGAAVSVKV